MHARDALNRILDRLTRPIVRHGTRSWSSFHVCGCTGLVLAIALGTALTYLHGLSLGVLAVVVLTAVATFLILAMATKIILGEERLIYYHHEVAILGMVALVLSLLRQPVLAYLDVTLLGVGTFLFCGRVGCFMVGCCHGRPHRWGVCYRYEHAETGFAPCFVSVRLFPIQLVESAWVFATMLVGVGLVMRGAAPGEALAWYVVVYDVGRFALEFYRGDTRPYRGGFSEGQWTSLLLMLVVVGAELGGAVPFHAWHLAATAGLVLTMIVVTLHRRLGHDARHRLLSARHIREVAEAVDLLTGLGGSEAPPHGDRERVVNVASTSAGLRISAGRVQEGEGEARHYTLSAASASLSAADARVLADLLLRLRHQGEPGEVVQGHEGVFHLLVRPATALRRASLQTSGTRGLLEASVT
jgi:hypothetical protein